jgi:hypothetical protein
LLISVPLIHCQRISSDLVFGICREKHGSAQLRKSTIMDCFLTISKTRKVEITNNEKSKAYENEKKKTCIYSVLDDNLSMVAEWH